MDQIDGSNGLIECASVGELMSGLQDGFGFGGDN